MENPRKKVLIVDADPVVRRGLMPLIQSLEIPCIFTEADSPSAARSAFEQWEPDVVVLDTALGGDEGFVLAGEFRASNALNPVLAFTSLGDFASVERARNSGVRYYVTRRDPISELLKAISCALQGERYPGPHLEKVHLEAINQLLMELDKERLALLSAREGQVYRLMRDGMLVQAVAAELGLTVKKVQTYVQRIMEKIRRKDGMRIILDPIFFRDSPIAKTAAPKSVPHAREELSRVSAPLT